MRHDKFVYSTSVKSNLKDAKVRNTAELIRPWGKVRIISNVNPSVRILEVKPMRRLSFHRHMMREELYISQDEDVIVELSQTEARPTEDTTKLHVLGKGEVICIPAGTWHRLGSRDRAISVVEVSYGTYDQVNDIERHDDDYGRVSMNGSI